MICSKSLIFLLILAAGSEIVSAAGDANSLASSIVANSCAATVDEKIELYKSLRQLYLNSSSNFSVHDTQYPETSDPRVNALDTVASLEVMSGDSTEHTVWLFYRTPSGDPATTELTAMGGFSALKEEYFEWCLHLYSEDNVYGCIKGNETRYSGGFELLGFLENMQYTSPPYGLVIKLQGPYVNAYDDALLSCTIDLPWLNVTRGSFWFLGIASHHDEIYFVDYPEQDDGFLVVGEQKIFSTDIFTTSHDGAPPISTWFADGNHVQSVVDVRNTNCTQLGGHFHGECINETIPITTSFIRFTADEFSSCQFADDYRTAKSRYFLSFNSPSINDTGEYTFIFAREEQESPAINRSFHISVVFTEFPFELSLPLGHSAKFTCGMKAPSTATVYWLYNNQPISNNCSEIATEREEGDEDGFSMINMELKLCRVTSEDIGQYSCVVDYTPPRSNRLHSARIDVHASFTIPKDNKGMPTEPHYQESVAIGASVATVAIVVIVISLLILILILRIRWTVKRKRRHTLKHRPSRHLLLKPNLLKGDDTYVDLTSPDIKKTGELEFPRQNLELQVELGTGKFGRVFKAKAYGMVSSFPHINTVAVKTTLNSGSFSENCRLLSELELLKKLYKQPHKNICNVLGHCIETDPLYIILEYACYGNLKRYLVSCRDALLRKGQEPQIHSSVTSVQIQQPNELTGQLAVVTSATNPLQINLNLSADLKDPTEKSVVPAETSFLEPGLIEESQLCGYAAQMANGLRHLAYMGVVHCDLAARNILIADKGVLKIGDFGMAREVSEKESPYQNLRVEKDDSMIAAKWAAPELLKMHPHTFKSDVWSYGITIWEIASYGAEPFSEFRMGASLEPFFRHLQEGNQPAVPAGLPNYLYRQLCNCWSVDPTSRPSAEELAEFFENVDPNTLALEDILEDVNL